MYVEVCSSGWRMPAGCSRAKGLIMEHMRETAGMLTQSILFKGPHRPRFAIDVIDFAGYPCVARIPY